MASRQSTKNRPGSPLKKQGSTHASAQQQHDDFSGLDRDLVRGLTEREVENEHLKTTIFALSEQVAVTSLPINAMIGG